MKKALFLVLIVGFLFASNNSDNNDINQKLNLILNKLNLLEQQINQKNKEIETLKKQLQIQQKEIKKQAITTKKEFAVKNCNNLKVVKFSYQYHDDILPYITFKVTLKNNYPYEITKIDGNLYFDDKDGTTLIKHYIKRKIDIKPGQSITISGQHMVITDMEKMIKNENPANLKVYFSPNIIDFKNAPALQCF